MLLLYTVTTAILLMFDHQASGMSLPQIPRIYDYGGLFAENQCRLKAIPDGSCYLEWAANHGWIKRTCPPGTRFVAEACQCLAVPQIDGEPQGKDSQIEPAQEALLTPVDCLLKPATHPASFMELVDGYGFVTRTCSESTVFSAQECACVVISETAEDEDKDVDSNKETIHTETATKEASDAEVAKEEVLDSKASCTKKAFGKSGFYMELVQGHGWMTRPCPEGTVFNTARCECLEAVVVADRTIEIAKSEDANQKIEIQETTISYPNNQETIMPVISEEKVDEKTTPSIVAPEAEPESSGEAVEIVETKPTPKPCKMKADTVSNRYLELVESHGWLSRPCPEGTTFSVKNCQCASTNLETDINPIVPEKKQEPTTTPTTTTTTTTAPCTRKPSHNASFYFQMTSGGTWILMKCAEGTAYNAQTCGCTSPSAGVAITNDASDDNNEDVKEPTVAVPSHQPKPDSDKETVCNKKPADHITRYQELVEGFGWIIRDCASGTWFDPGNCACVVAHPVKNVDKDEEPCDSAVNLLKKMMSTQYDGSPVSRNQFCMKKPSMNVQFYYELVGGVRWVTRVCSKGTIFVPRLCHCSLPISNDVRDKEVVNAAADASIYEKMLAQKIFNPWNGLNLNTAPQPQPSFYPYQPTQSKYETVQDPNFRIY